MAAKSLVIVESPAKAKTIGQYLGGEYRVMASVGHVVDLPQSGLCVDVENDFKLTYEVTKKDVIKDLKEALKGASALLLATDEDREGEAIAWHLKEQLKPRVPTRRMVFHEITKKAIHEAVQSPRDIDQGLVDAQETRRTLDRLYGYEVSPVLWRKVKSGLSAGRVQSPAIRLIVERERERMRFRPVTSWDVTATHPTAPPFESTLVMVGEQRVAQGRDFGDDGTLKSPGVLWVDEARATALATQLAGQTFTVRSVERKPYRSRPQPPFMTSTLQQEGGRKLNMSAQQVMRVAQGLYERGYITYMRTDSITLSDAALAAARTQVKALFGAQYLPPQPRQYTRKVKNAQEAHEAIRPAGDSFRTPEELAGELNASELKLYDLIWKRTLASQMADAEGESVSIRLRASTTGGEAVEFSASGRTLSFPGYLKAYVESAEDRDADQEEEMVLPPLKEGDVVPVASLAPKGHTTAPPARYTEASLVKKLEELGIGRPSTYASIIGTLQAKYVWKKGQALIPNWEAFAVVALMERHFTDLVDLEFTAELEEDLDQIAVGDREKVGFLKEFYFGDKKHQGLKKQVTQNIERIDAAEVNSILIGKDPAGVDIVVKPGRYGPYIRRGEDTVGLPETIPPDEVTVAKALALLSAPRGDTPVGVDPRSGKPVYVKQGRFGPYVQLGDATDEEKPRTASLFKSMKPEAVTLAQALELLTLPRVVGTAPDGEPVIAQNGRYGPYLSKGKETRNLGVENEHRLLTIGLAEALELFRQPKQFRGRGQPRPPLATWKDPSTGKDVQLKEGRFGLYVTDGDINASLRKGDDPAELTAERVSEMLQQRREYLESPEGQAKAKAKGARRGKAAGKKAPAAKASAKAKAKAATPHAKGKRSGKETAAPPRAARKGPDKKARSSA